VVATRLGVTTHSLYAWIKKYGSGSEAFRAEVGEQAEIFHLRKELKRVEEERDIYKKSRSILREAIRLRYAFVCEHKDCWPVRWMCRMLKVHPWLLCLVSSSLFRTP